MTPKHNRAQALGQLAALRKSSVRHDRRYAVTVAHTIAEGDLKQHEAADQLGVSQTTVSRLIKTAREIDHATSSTQPATVTERTAWDIVSDALAGKLTHDELLEQLRSFTYELPHETQGLGDDFEIRPNSLDMLSDAFYEDLITEEEYDELWRTVNTSEPAR